LQLACELFAAVEIPPRDPQHLNSESGQRTVASPIGMKRPPRALDELGPRIGKAMFSIQGTEPALCLAFDGA
jgi:hypothetical protein